MTKLVIGFPGFPSSVKLRNRNSIPPLYSSCSEQNGYQALANPTRRPAIYVISVFEKNRCEGPFRAISKKLPKHRRSSYASGMSGSIESAGTKLCLRGRTFVVKNSPPPICIPQRWSIINGNLAPNRPKGNMSSCCSFALRLISIMFRRRFSGDVIR